jgi:glyoxylase-like metal-dependent hydrolase (beta-lactamase superfamily II)
MQVFERGWLSANNILFAADDGATLVDTGYCTHSPQTIALVVHALAQTPLTRIINTHLHSDHCGGNAALKQRYPHAQIFIPPGESAAVRAWDEDVLTYRATAQDCPRFMFDGIIAPGTELVLGGSTWQVLSAPGHDPHSVVLYCPQHKLLISADALWENGFGLVFPELEGEQAFQEVAATLDVIADLDVDVVIPGHGAPFRDCAAAIARARSRLEAHVANPAKHAFHAVKALLMYRMMAEQRADAAALIAELANAALFQQVARRWFDEPAESTVARACDELVNRGQLVRQGTQIALA